MRSPVGNIIRLLAVTLAALCIPAGLLLWAVPHFVEGSGIERTDLAWDSLIRGPRLSRGAYAIAAGNLDFVIAGDGATLARKAAFTAIGPHDTQHAIALARAAVAASPANPQAWVLLCEILAQTDFARAARCLDTALVVAPFDWYVAGRRASLAASIWPALGADTRKAAAREVRRLWTTDGLRDELWGVMERGYGPTLVQYAFQGDRESLRAFNRWYIRKELCAGACSPKVD